MLLPSVAFGTLRKFSLCSEDMGLMERKDYVYCGNRRTVIYYLLTGKWIIIY